jgi:hypothetical protein
MADARKKGLKMRKTLYCGVALHSNNALYVITDAEDKQLLQKRLPNELPVVLKTLAPFRPRPESDRFDGLARPG